MQLIKKGSISVGALANCSDIVFVVAIIAINLCSVRSFNMETSEILEVSQ